MELNLQFGYGMMEHSRALLKQWGGGQAVLSPRDLSPEQLCRLAADIRRIPGGEVLLDPQFYLPHSEHRRLRSHAYWPSDYPTDMLLGGPGLASMVGALCDLNSQLGTCAVVTPGLLARRVTDDWLAHQQTILAEVTATAQGHLVYQTVALSADAVRFEDDIATLLAHCERDRAAAYYVVCEHPNGRYLVDDPIWLANLLDLAAGLKLLGSTVLLGYSNQQLLVAAAAKVDALASGTWMNVRAFPPEKFQASYDDEVKQRAIWYYAPSALSEYKLPFLDIAQRQGLLELLAPDPFMMSPEVGALFAGPQPSATGLSEQAAFRHYLNCFRSQILTQVKGTFDDTVGSLEEGLGNATALLTKLSEGRVSGQHRDFRDIVDVNQAALATLVRGRGAMLRRRWAELGQ
ncbi:MAG: hypothetical protein HYU66_29745 [Armatimonadetes bacterium]|nr:hypothetical protein [Armatimonadota bacterium]